MLIGKYFNKVKAKYKNHYFSGLSFNSKKCRKNHIFFAIKGANIDGNTYVEDAIDNGARTIVSQNKFEGIKDGILYLKTLNTRKLLAKTSFKIIKKKPNNLIAVTGTNGKSSVADFYFQILKLNNQKVASIGTLGIKKSKNYSIPTNTTLDPLKLSQELMKLKDKNIENVILEASSHGLKQNRLDGLKFNIGIFTNLSHDHLDYHKNFNDYLNSKMYLFKHLLKKKSCIITDKEIPEYKKLKSISLKKRFTLNTISNFKSYLQIISHKYFGEKQIINLKYKNKIYTLKLNLLGKIQIKNILMSMIAAKKSGLDFKKIVNTINKIKPVNGRLEKIGNIKNKSFVVLDFAHTPEALRTCLINLKDQFRGKKISIVFGCGGDRDKKKRRIMGKIANVYCNQIYLTDDNPRNENPKNIRLEVKKNIDKKKLKEIPSRAKAIHHAIQDLKTGELLIVAGKGHENIQDYGKKKKFFSDRKLILKSIKLKNKNLSDDFKMNIIKEESKKNFSYINYKINKASINSQEIKKNDIFFAIKGKKNNGNTFIQDAFKKGASYAVVNKIYKKEKKNKQIKVQNTLNFLTKTSSLIRQNLDAKIIAITGSCGKTSLKELLGKSMNSFAETFYSPKSYNNKFGVPISLFNLQQKHKFGVFEVGMDKRGEIDYLTKIIQPDIGVITNISHAHAKNFKNIRQIALAKSEIINQIKLGGCIVLNADDKFYDLHKKIAKKRNIKIYSFSIKNRNSNIRLMNIKRYKNKFKINVLVNKIEKVFFINSNFENYIKNLLAAIAIISIFKNVKSLNQNIFYNFSIPLGRGDISKIKINNKNIFLIDESYNSNPLSVKSAIKNFDNIDIKSQKKYLILGDMLELGSHSKRLHLNLSSIINSSKIDKVNVIGKHIKETYRNIKKKKKGLILNENLQIIDLIKNDLNNNDYLMIKGSNSTGLNKFTNNLKVGKFNAI